MTSTFPPFDPLHRAVAALESVGIAVALGGSGLLAALDLADQAHDWDLTTDAPLDQVRSALEGFDLEAFGPSGIHGDHKFRVEQGVVEIIVGFAIRAGEATVHLPTIVTTRWNGVAVGSPEVWAVAYTLMGRPEKASRLFDWLAENGADPGARDRLTTETLPAALVRRLAALPVRR